MRRISVVVSFVALLVACSSDDDGPLAQAPAVAQQYATNVHENYADALDKARDLQQAIDSFVAQPSLQSLESAKSAWVNARAPYGLTEVYRFYSGPIDDEDRSGGAVEGFINAWPLDENFIDYTIESQNGGIINDIGRYPQITLSSIRSANESGGEKTISTGYHAIEFLLWGQDLDIPGLRTPGRRQYTDYVVGQRANADRRGQYLKLVAEMLVSDLEGLVRVWEPEQRYPKDFVADGKAAVTKILTGMGSLANAELAGERMTVAYKNRGQEDEHSCFSDTTNADLLANLRGIQNAYLGRYGSSDGPGIEDLVQKADAALDTEFKKRMSEALSALQSMQSVPFDAAIAAPDGDPARQNVLNAIQRIKRVGALIPTIGDALGLSFTLEEPSETL